MDDDTEQGPVVQKGSRPDRINKRSIEEIATKKGEGKDKTITIYYRPTQSHGLLPFLHKFSRTAATVFSKTMENQLGESGTYAVIEGTNLKAYKQIFDWINMCVDVGNDEKFPETTDSTTNPLTNLLDVIVAAQRLRIPEGSLNMHLKKRLFRLAREHLIDLEHVRRIYDDFDPDYAELELQEIASVSIFEAWWQKKLDGEEYDDYMYELSHMRDNIAELDNDLHQAFENKRQFLEEKYEQKKRERKAAAMGGNMQSEHFGGSNGWTQAQDTASVLGDGVTGVWNNTPGDANMTWDRNQSVNFNESAANISLNTDVITTPTFEPTGSHDQFSLGADKDVVSWADEMNENQCGMAEVVKFRPSEAW